MKWRLGTMVVMAWVLVLAGPAVAAEDGQVVDDSIFRFRLSPPFCAIGPGMSVGMGGGSVSYQWDLWELEFGGDYFLGIEAVGFDLFARGGLDLALYDGRRGAEDPSGWRIAWLLLGGYQFWLIDRGAHEHDPGGTETHHGLTLTTGFEFTYWFGAHLGLNLGLLATGGLVVASAGTDEYGSDGPFFFPSAALTMGLSF